MANYTDKYARGMAQEALTAIADILQQPIIEVTENRVISATDLNKKLHFNSESDLTCTISPDNDLAAEIGSGFTVVRKGVGTVTFVGSGGVAINSVDDLKSVTKNAGVIVYKEAANTWCIIGALE